VLTVIAAAIAGAIPALQSTGRGMETTLKEFGSRSGLRLGATWTTLIVAQVALAVAGLPLAAAAFWGDISGAATTTAFEPRPYLAAVLSGDTEPPPGVDPESYRRELAIRNAGLRAELATRVEAEPRVEDVARAVSVPGDERAAQIEIDGAAAAVSGAINVRPNDVSSDFFDTFGAALVAGRFLTETDAVSEVRPVVVNQAFVRRVLGDRAAIGVRIRYTPDREDGLAAGETPDGSERADGNKGPWHEVVGVVTDLYTNPVDPQLVESGIFHPISEAAAARATLLIKVRGRDAAAFTPRLRDVARSLDPTARLVVRSFVDMERQQQLALRLLLLVLALITVAVLLLSAAGIYALMSFTVSRRRKEIGIRAAMGADAGQLLRGIFARSAAQLVTGVTIGAALALLVDVMSGGETLGTTGRLVFVPVMAVAMIAVGLIASVGPARRGLNVQPTEALRAE
jgi:putative ABC transport system permease protein